jgi:DNA (cytosine-5-)-methyltransferase
MGNLSQQKRLRMLEFLNKIKEDYKDDDKILASLGEIENEINSKKYGLIWEKHEEQVDAMMRNHIPVFTEVNEKEINATSENSFNFLLEGDNLHSLKLLEKTHLGRIDVIYIDPPYNTGNKDFIYNDNLIDNNDNFFHSKWLSFMFERLIIARRLLSEDGVIFINIDENEAHQLKLLLDEVFFEFNLVGEFIWKARSGKSGTNSLVATSHEYVYCYSKNKNRVNFFSELKINNKDKKEALRQWGQNVFREDRPTMFFPIFYKDTVFCLPEYEEYRNIYTSNKEFDDAYLKLLIKKYENKGYICVLPEINGRYGRWRKSFDGVKELIKNNLLILDQDNHSKFIIKKLIPSGKMTSTAVDSLLSDVDTASHGTLEMKKIFKGKKVFSTTKPIKLVKTLINYSVHNKLNACVLDFFAGSGTTGHAVMQLNKEDGGNRRFILCTNNENNICEEVTYKRIKNVINGYDDVPGIPANLKYYKTKFVNKYHEELSDELMKHIQEMVQLEQGIKIDNQKYMLILSDEDADELERNWHKDNQLKALYVSQDVLFTASQNKLFSNVEIHVIPDYYFGLELKEAGESW